jgi:hypothetical protein
MRSALVVVGVTLVVAACVHVSKTVLNPAMVLRPVPPEQVRIIRDSTDLVGLEYERVAILRAAGDHRSADEEDLYKALRKEAGKLGANAVIYTPPTDPTTGQKVFTLLLFHEGAEREVEVLAIRVWNPNWD